MDFLKEKEEECRNSDEVTCNKEYFKRVVDATLGIKLYSVISYTMSLSPTHITAFLAGTRFLQIRYPLHPLQLKYVISSLLITITWVPVVVGCAMFDVSDKEGCTPKKDVFLPSAWSYCPRVLGIQIDSFGYFWFIIALPVILQIGAMIASVLTITELVKVYLNPVSECAGKADNRIRSCSKILLTNLGSLILVIVIIVTAFHSDVEGEYSIGNVITYLMFQTVIPSLISMLNPIIYIILTPNFKLKYICIVGISTDRTN